ncbi:hypothetical protein [Actinoplanes sp. NPDC049118]|uniref:hypothetical protein n=1 Tax=Actinoplanes sp. NPDC049118 TaxID=3155769 RepID=UPI003410864F
MGFQDLRPGHGADRKQLPLLEPGGYHRGEGLRVVLDTKGKRHSTEIKAYDYHR